MLAFTVRRLLWAVPLLFATTLVTFIIFFVVSPQTTSVGRGATYTEFNLREQFELERSSLAFQYGEWVWYMISEGSLGQSYITRLEVTDMLAAALPVTAFLILGGTIFFIALAVPLGVLSALRPRSFLDRAGMVFVLIGVSAHPAWIGLVLSYFFGFKLGWTPITGYCDFVNPSTLCGGPIDWAWHMLLPWLTFAFLFGALYTRMIRAAMLETLSEDYVQTARAKGAPPWRVLRVHVMRNSMLPVVAMLGMDVGLAFGGAIFIETVYGLPGVGRLAINAAYRRDLPVIVGVVLVVTTAVVLFNLIVDLIHARLDPRVRQGASRGDLAEAALLPTPGSAPTPAPVASPVVTPSRR